MKTDHLFTGQLEVGLGGIYSYGARFYSPRLGRFLSADTIVPNFADPQSLNRFSYVGNNPLKYVDPSGHTKLCGVQCEEDWFGTPTKPPAASPCVCAPPPTSSSDNKLDAGLPIPTNNSACCTPSTPTVDTASTTNITVDSTLSNLATGISTELAILEGGAFNFNYRLVIPTGITGELYYLQPRISWTANGMSSAMRRLQPIGLGLAVIPRQVADFQAGAPGEVMVADALIDTAIWGTSVKFGAGVGGIFGGLPGALVGAGAGMLFAASLDTTFTAMNVRSGLADLVAEAGANVNAAVNDMAPYSSPWGYP